MADELKIDFGNTQSCNTYLMSKFDDLLTGINNLYGKELMNELIQRLEKTIAQFHKDVKILISDIQSEETKQSFRSGISVLPKPQNNEAPKINPEQTSMSAE